MDLGIDHGEFARDALNSLAGGEARTPDWAVLRARMCAQYEARHALVRAAMRGPDEPHALSEGSFDIELAQKLRGLSIDLSAVNQKVSVHCKAGRGTNEAAAAMTRGGQGQQ